MYALDSDLLIAFLRGEPDARTALRDHEDTRTTVFSALELLSGTEPASRREQEALRLLQTLHPVAFDWNEMTTARRISDTLARQGTPIGRNDELIAGICIANGLTLVTRNRKQFSKIKGLKTVAW